jgi:hypothetical protein
MEHKKVINILIKILEKYTFTAEEKEAVMDAIGILSWTSLADSRRQAIKEKKEKEKRERSSLLS